MFILCFSTDVHIYICICIFTPFFLSISLDSQSASYLVIGTQYKLPMSPSVRLWVGCLVCRNFLKRQESYSSIPLTRVLYFHVLQLLISHYIFLYIYLSLTLRYCTYLFTSHSSIISLYIPTSGLRPSVRASVVAVAEPYEFQEHLFLLHMYL